MNIQRQVISQQADIMAQQSFQSALLHTHHTGVFALPKVAMMDEDQIALGSHRSIDQFLAGGNPADYLAHVTAPLNLQSIRAVISYLRRIEIMVGPFDQGAEFYCHFQFLLIDGRLLLCRRLRIMLALYPALNKVACIEKAKSTAAAFSCLETPCLASGNS